MLLFLCKIVRPDYCNENSINVQVGPGEHKRMVIENMIEGPAPIDSGDELTIVDNEDHIVKDDIAMNGVEIPLSTIDMDISKVGSVRYGLRLYSDDRKYVLDTKVP
jgi:hypothetical protein